MTPDGRSLFERSLAAVRHNARQLAVDLLLIVAWLILGTEALRLLGVPRWLQYVVLFGGIIVYVQLTPSWEHPPVDQT